ncbi:MAG: small multi-drug export protein [Firmicutes bacterium]|nr:small multi-drug export protein [Bacillota bacterium]MTI71696.1 small multi-drug export protein [Bacillota bacterium]
MGEYLSLIKEQLFVMLIAATPILELRGAIPVGIGLGFTPFQSTVMSIIGNIIPVPILLLLLNPVFNYFEHTKYIGDIINWLKERTLRRSDKVKKYRILGLFLLVAIPLPTTGAYTGCVAACLFDIKFKHALPTVILGVVAAGMIMFTLSSLGVQMFS